MVLRDLLNGMTLSFGELWDNLHLHFGMELLGIC